MKNLLLTIAILLAAITFSQAQNRSIARGANAGELYHAHLWYGTYDPIWGPPYYDTLRSALYHFTENGKKLTIQYDVDYFANEHNPPESVMIPTYILADATPGVVYNKCFNYKDDGYTYTQLWVSFDYGKNWLFREENIGSYNYYVSNFDGLMYRGGGGGVKSADYALNFSKMDGASYYNHSELGWEEEEVLAIGTYVPYQGVLIHAYDFKTYFQIPIDSLYLFGQVSGIFPDVYRGGKAGEVYVSSLFPEPEYKISYKISFSADTGYTFRHVYVSENYNSYDLAPMFMSDREPGVFYIIHTYYVEDINPLGWHKKYCIYYYRDYGETLVDIYCHDITKDYGNVCEAVNDLVLEKCSNNCILLSWSEPESSLPVERYSIFRNNIQITNRSPVRGKLSEANYELRENVYLDENLPNGNYEYYVVTHYTTGCISDSSNHIKETIELGINKEMQNDNITIFPNPTTGELHISHISNLISQIEIYDVYGKKQKAECRKQNAECRIQNAEWKLDISNLYTGIYLITIATDKGITTKKIIKY